MERERPSEHSLYDSLWEDGYVLKSALAEQEPQFLPSIQVLIDVGRVTQTRIQNNDGSEDFILQLVQEDPVPRQEQENVGEI